MENKNVIKITHFINPHLFWFKLDILQNKELRSLERELEDWILNDEENENNPIFTIGEVVGVLQLTVSKWIRARVKLTSEEKIILWAMDHGIPLTSDIKWIKRIPKHLAEKKINSIYVGGLNNVVPAEWCINFSNGTTEKKMKTTWSETAVDHFRKIINESKEITFFWQKEYNSHFFGELQFLTRQNMVFKLSDVLINTHQGMITNNFSTDFQMMETTNILCYHNNNNSMAASILSEITHTGKQLEIINQDNQLTSEVNGLGKWELKDKLTQDPNLFFDDSVSTIDNCNNNNNCKNVLTDNKISEETTLCVKSRYNYQKFYNNLPNKMPTVTENKSILQLPEIKSSSNITTNTQSRNQNRNVIAADLIQSNSVILPGGFDLLKVQNKLEFFVGFRKGIKKEKSKESQIINYNNLQNNTIVPQSSKNISSEKIETLKNISSESDNYTPNTTMTSIETTSTNSRESSTKSGQKIPCVQNKYVTINQNYDINVFVHGKNIPMPINKISEANFKSEVHDDLNYRRIKETYRIQSYSWPHIMRGNSLVMISSGLTGKTIGYIPALFSVVKRKIDDDLIIKNVGPLAIIICSSSREVDELFNTCKKFNVGKRRIEIVKAYGLRDNIDVMGHILNGCAILITTPKCLNRLVAHNKEIKLFDKMRLQHLVIDNIDLMFDNFKEDLQCIFESLLTFEKSGEIMQQLIITSKVWHPYLRSILKKAKNSILIIGAYIEAAVYGRSQISLSLQTKDKKLNAISEFLLKHNYNYERTIIVCVNQDEVEYVSEYLKAMSLIHIMCHEHSDENIIGLAKEWKNHAPGSLPILVCSDDILVELKIDNAINMIHFSLSNSWTKFSCRFSTIFNSITDELKDKIIEKNKPRFLILLDETNTTQLPRLIHFLHLHNPNSVNDEIVNFANKIKIQNEKNKSVKSNNLCKYILEYGTCKLEFCRNRHILTKIDMPNKFYPTEGIVKLQILSVITPTHYVARILYAKNFKQNSKWEIIKNSDNLSAFNLKLKQYYLNKPMCPNHYPFDINDICTYKDDDSIYHRCEIINKTELKKSTLIEIRCIDSGEKKNCSPEDLFYLDEELKLFPPQAIDVRLTGLIPLDFDLEWNSIARKTVENWVFNREIENYYIRARIDFSLNCKIWTKSLEIVEILDEIQSETLNINIKANLIEKKFAIAYDEPLKLLKQIAIQCGITQINEDNFQSQSPDDKNENNFNENLINKTQFNNLEISKLPPNVNVNVNNIITGKKSSDSDNQSVTSKMEIEFNCNLLVRQEHWIELKEGIYEQAQISEFIDPDQLFIRCYEDKLGYENMLAELDKFTENELNLKNKSFNNLINGQICIAKDGIYFNRGIIYDINYIEQKILVFLCDEGHTIELTIDSIYEIPEYLLILPFQTIQCKLTGIQSKNKNNIWPNDTSNNIYSTFFENTFFNFYVRSFTKKIDNIFLKNEYEIILIDKTTNENINKLIVEKGYADYNKNTKHYLEIVIDINKSSYESGEEENIEDIAKYDDDDEEWDKCNIEVPKTSQTTNTNDHLYESNFEIVFDDDDLKELGLPSTAKIVLPDHKTNNNVEIETKIKNNLNCLERKYKSIEKNKLNANLNDPYKKMPLLVYSYNYPTVIWHQNNFNIFLTISATDVIKYALKVRINGLNLRLQFEGKRKNLNINFIGCVDESLTFHEIRGLNINIQLKKKIKGLTWPRLTFENDYQKWLSYNINHMTTKENLVQTISCDNSLRKHDEMYDSSDDSEEFNNENDDQEYF